MAEKLTDKEVVAVDGKTLRRSYKRNDRQSTLHMISAFATKNGVVLGQRRTDEKSLYQTLQDAFELSDSNEPGHIEQKHGRVEYRAYDVLSALELPESIRSAWSALETIGRATYYRLANGKEQLQYRYYISSACLSAE